MSQAQPPAEARPAATVLLLRDTPAFEVLMVKRHHQIDFASGALVFPGGKSHPGDHDPRWAAHAAGWADLDATQRGLRVAAVREAFEETGILLADTADGRPFAEACDPQIREAVDAGRLDFIDVAQDLGVRLRLDSLVVFARWITPEPLPKRFDTWFYVVRAPADQVAACDGREAVDAEWITPGEALRLGALGERTVIFPTRMNLRLLAEATSAADAVARAAERPLVTVLPEIRRAGEGEILVLPEGSAYGPVVEPLDPVMVRR